MDSRTNPVAHLKLRTPQVFMRFRIPGIDAVATTPTISMPHGVAAIEWPKVKWSRVLQNTRAILGQILEKIPENPHFECWDSN